MFEDRDTADRFSEAGEHVYEVELVDQLAARSRHDALFLTWMGESGATPPAIDEWCERYWRGECTRTAKPTAQPMWEVLAGCDLWVVRRMP